MRLLLLSGAGISLYYGYTKPSDYTYVLYVQAAVYAAAAAVLMSIKPILNELLQRTEDEE